MNFFNIKSFIKNESGNFIIENEMYEKKLAKNNEKIKEIPIIIIEEILNNKSLYNEVYKMFVVNNQNIKLTIFGKNLDDTPRLLTCDKKEFINCLNQILNKLTPKQIKRAKELIRTREYSFYEDNIANKISIDNITIKEIIDLLSKDEKDFDILLKKERILGISNQQLVSILNSPPFLLQSEELSICKSFNFDDELAQKIIANYVKINYLYSKDELAEQPFFENTFDMSEVEINEKLASDLLKEISSFDFSKLQKIYYIYRRLCQKLTYDEEYFAGSQSRFFSINHKDINRLKKINDNNNIVICYEVTMILAKFCEILDIPFNILTYKDKEVLEYGKGHTKIRFKIEDFIVEADPTHGIIRSDLVSEKTEQIVENFLLLNTNPRSKDNFLEQTQEVDDILEINKKEHNFLDCTEIYQHFYLQDKGELTIEQRVELLSSLIVETKLDIMDSLEYFLNLRKIIFGIKYNSNCQFIYVSNNKPNDTFKKVCVTLIIVYNNEEDIEHNKDNNYILIESDKTIQKITKEELQALFDNKKLTLIGNSKLRKIPGIKIKEEVSDEDYEQVRDITTNRSKA